jgi:CcmD family protein
MAVVRVRGLHPTIKVVSSLSPGMRLRFFLSLALFSSLWGVLLVLRIVMAYIALAYGFIWIAVFGYVVLVRQRVAQIEAEIEDLRERVRPNG